MLRMQGHTVRPAATLTEARQQLTVGLLTHVILDLNLPDGLGTDLLSMIQTQSITVRVLLLTGSSDANVIAEARQLGVDAVLTKPPNWDEVIRWASSE